MARLAGRRTRTPESEEGDESREQTPLSTAPNDRKRARRIVEEADEPESDGSQVAPAPTQTGISERKPTFLNVKPTSGHQPGAIVRIRLKNFVTYTTAEFFPGASLNMIIGPNGTGKSTFVCAICLGLGWATSFLGRAKDAAEYVKHGCREAVIEIELQRKTSGPGATKANPVITRIIRRDGNKSKWMVNGKDNTQKGVQSLCKNTFNIQIDNLCQFLPQDKVVEFAQMNPIEILSSTQRAAGTPEMLEHHENLKKLRSAQKEMMHNNRGDREQLENLERRQEMQRTDVERMKERAITQKRLEWLEQSRSVPAYGDAKTRRDEARARQQSLKAELDRLKAELEPTQRRLKEKEAYTKQIQRFAKATQQAESSAQQNVVTKKSVVTDLKTKCADLEINLAAEKKSPAKRKEQRAKTLLMIGELEIQLSEKPPEFDSRAMVQEMKDRKDEINHLGGQLEESKARIQELMIQGKRRQGDIKQLRKDVESMETQSGQQESKLQRMSTDTFNAWRWIQENQELFEKHVYGPPLVECSLKDPNMASQVESFLRPSHFKIITAQTAKDFALLQQKLNREMNYHDISLRSYSESDLSRFKRPFAEENMRTYGLESYVIDHLEGPGPVLAMLCNETYLHQSAIASRSLGDEQHEALAKSELKSYVCGQLIHQFSRRAEYGKDGHLSRATAVRPAEYWTAQSVDMGRKAAVERSIAEKSGEASLIREEHQKCGAEIEKLSEKIKKLRGEIEEIRKDKDAKQTQLTAWNALPLKISELQGKVECADKWLSEVKDRIVNIEKKRDETIVAQGQAVVQLVESISELKDAREDRIHADVLLIQATSDLETFKDRNKDVADLLIRLTAEEEKAVQTVAEASHQASQLIIAVRALMAAAQKLEREGEPGFLEILQKMSANTGGATRWTAEQLDAEIDSQKAQLALTEGGSIHVIREFEDRAKAIEKLQSKLADFDKRGDDLSNAITEVRERWEPQLEGLVSQISAAFGDSFARIGCAGQVAVHKASSEDMADCTEEKGGAENGLDFANWAIHISVKFRENEPLSLLDSHRQSGGERAVSTIFYLMALQSLSRAPFRVVDEINQGMDPRNERMVHGRLVDIATEGGGSQYFLITPKLLSGLKYKRGMTVLCIVSGENVPGEKAMFEDQDQVSHPAPKMDFTAFARRARELGMAGGVATGERRVDSGVGLGSSFTSTSGVEVGA